MFSSREMKWNISSWKQHQKRFMFRKKEFCGRYGRRVNPYLDSVLVYSFPIATHSKFILFQQRSRSRCSSLVSSSIPLSCGNFHFSLPVIHHSYITFHSGVTGLHLLPFREERRFLMGCGQEADMIRSSFLWFVAFFWVVWLEIFPTSPCKIMWLHSRDIFRETDTRVTCIPLSSGHVYSSRCIFFIFVCNRIEWNLLFKHRFHRRLFFLKPTKNPSFFPLRCSCPVVSFRSLTRLPLTRRASLLESLLESLPLLFLFFSVLFFHFL